MPHRYHLYGLSIESELQCPELTLQPEPAAPAASAADCIWQLADLTPELPQASFANARVQVAPGIYQFLTEGVARYRVEQGERILIDPVPGAAEGDVRLWLLGTALGALLHQRELLPLHVSALAIDGAVVAFCGDSGAGKSTLAAALHRRGLPLLTDDVGLVVPQPEAQPDGVRFYPGFPRIKLWRDALDHFGLDHRPLIRDLTRTDKYHLQLSHGFHAEPLPLRRLYLLERNPDPSDHTVRLDPVRGHAAIDLIRANTYRQGLVRRLGRAAEHLRACGRIAQQVAVFRFQRPWALDQLEVGIDALLEQLQAETEAG